MEMVCVACGGTYGAEPGPQLCGPCWIDRGRPDIWPRPITPFIPPALVPVGHEDYPEERE